VREIFDLLSSKGIIDGCALTGAGGGGFMSMLLHKGKTVEDAKEVLNQSKNLRFDWIRWYPCKVSHEGLEYFICNDSVAFNRDWHVAKAQT
jgi:mevalonate kinase